MDRDAVMVIQTPLAMVVHSALGTEGLTEHGLSFHPERGTAQGGVDSSLVYAAFLDILLCALDIANDPANNFYMSDIDGTLQPTDPIAYVDDLVCVTGTPLGLQSIANLVSAFCIVFQIQLNSSKFRTFAVNWGNDKSPHMESLTIYTKGWLPLRIPMLSDGTMKHLGVVWDMSLHNQSMFDRIFQDATTALDLIVKSSHSATVRLAVIKTSLMNSLVYETKFTTWSLQQYQQIDTLFNKAYRLISKNQRTFPTKLLYLKQDHLGLGFPQYSSQVQLAKLHLLQRSTYSSNPRRQFIINSLTGRVIRQMRCQPCRYGPYQLNLQPNSILPHDNRQTWWFSSLAQHMSLTGITLERNNLATTHLPSPIPSTLNNSLSRNASLLANGISIPQELHMASDDLNTLTRLGLGWASDQAVPTQPTPIRQGQVWAIHNILSLTYTIFEIVGFLGDQSIMYLPWQCTKHSKDGLPLKVSLAGGTAAMRGAGSTNSSSISTLFSSDQNLVYYLVTLGNESYILGANTATVKALREREPLIPQLRNTRDTHPWFLNVNSEITHHTTTTPSSTVLDKLMGRTKYNSSSILIKTDHINNSWQRHGLVLHGHRNLSNRDISVLTLYVASSQSHNPRQTFIATTSTGQALHRKAASKPVADPLTPILQPSKAHRMFCLPTLTKEQAKALTQIKKSPQTTLNLTGPQRDEANVQTRLFLTRTIHISERQLQSLYPGSTITRTNYDDFLQPLKYNHNGVICEVDNHQPFLECYLSKHLDIMAKKYYTDRDEYRRNLDPLIPTINNVPDYWKDSSVSLAAAVLKNITNVSTRAMATRIVFDWHLTGRNKLKQKVIIDEAKCPLCGAEMENQQHILLQCSHVHMQAVRDTHMQEITRLLKSYVPSSFSTKLINAFHAAAILPDQYELLLGRIHPHILPSIESFPTATLPEQAVHAYSSLVTHCRQYLAMAIDLYQTRQTIINHQKEDPNWNGIITDIDPVRMRNLTHENLMKGISTNHFLNLDGTKILKQIDGDIAERYSYKRKIVDITNSVFCRAEATYFEKRAKIEELRNEKKRNIDDLKSITIIDQHEWNRRYFPTDSIDTNTPAHPSNDESSGAIFLQKQASALQSFDNCTYQYFSELGAWYPPPSLETIPTPSNDNNNNNIHTNNTINHLVSSSTDSNNNKDNNYHNNNNISDNTTPPSQLSSTTKHMYTTTSNNNNNIITHDQQSYIENNHNHINNNKHSQSQLHPVPSITTTNTTINTNHSNDEYPTYINNAYNNNINNNNNNILTNTTINDLVSSLTDNNNNKNKINNNNSSDHITSLTQFSLTTKHIYNIPTNNNITSHDQQPYIKNNHNHTIKNNKHIQSQSLVSYTTDTNTTSNNNYNNHEYATHINEVYNNNITTNNNTNNISLHQTSSNTKHIYNITNNNNNFNSHDQQSYIKNNHNHNNNITNLQQQSNHNKSDNEHHRQQEINNNNLYIQSKPQQASFTNDQHNNNNNNNKHPSHHDNNNYNIHDKLLQHQQIHLVGTHYSKFHNNINNIQDKNTQQDFSSHVNDNHNDNTNNNKNNNSNDITTAHQTQSYSKLIYDNNTKINNTNLRFPQPLIINNNTHDNNNNNNTKYDDEDDSNNNTINEDINNNNNNGITTSFTPSYSSKLIYDNNPNLNNTNLRFQQSLITNNNNHNNNSYNTAHDSGEDDDDSNNNTNNSNHKINLLYSSKYTAQHNDIVNTRPDNNNNQNHNELQNPQEMNNNNTPSIPLQHQQRLSSTNNLNFLNTYKNNKNNNNNKKQKPKNHYSHQHLQTSSYLIKENINNVNDDAVPNQVSLKNKFEISNSISETDNHRRKYSKSQNSHQSNTDVDTENSPQRRKSQRLRDFHVNLTAQSQQSRQVHSHTAKTPRTSKRKYEALSLVNPHNTTPKFLVSKRITNYFSQLPVNLPPSINIISGNYNQPPNPTICAHRTVGDHQDSEPKRSLAYPTLVLSLITQPGPVLRCSPGTPGGPTGQG